MTIEEVRHEIRSAIADAFRALAASSGGNSCTMTTSADLRHVADIVEGSVLPDDEAAAIRARMEQSK